MVPVRQPVDDQVVLAGLLQVERLDGHALDLEAHGVAADGDAQIELAHDVLEAQRPADVGAQ